MKKLVALFVLFGLPACAIGKLQEAAEALEEAEKKIGELAVAECMSECSDSARECFNQANGTCVDGCEIVYDACLGEEKACLNQAYEVCSIQEGAAFHECMHSYDDFCDWPCDQNMSNCGQKCGDKLSDCFFQEQLELEDPSYSKCVSDCVDEMEKTLKDIDL